MKEMDRLPPRPFHVVVQSLNYPLMALLGLPGQVGIPFAREGQHMPILAADEASPMLFLGMGIAKMACHYLMYFPKKSLSALSKYFILFFLSKGTVLSVNSQTAGVEGCKRSFSSFSEEASI